MARMRTLQICALNIAMHPHSPDEYVKLLQRAQRKRIAAQYYGNRWGRIGTLRSRDSAYVGQLHLYTDFDPKLPWLNLERGQAAEPEELNAVQLPKDMKPEFSEVPFVFLPDCHRLVLAANRLSPKSALRLARRILLNRKVRGTEQEVAVNLVQSKSTLAELYGHPKLISVEVRIDRPNPDELESYEERLQERLRKIKASRLIETVQSEFGKSLTPDNELKELGTVAMTNGRVDIAYRDTDGVKKTTSSEDTPHIETFKFDPSKTNELDLIFAHSDLFRKLPK